MVDQRLIKSKSVEQVVIACPSYIFLGLLWKSLRSQLIDLNASSICFFDACWLTIPFWQILNATRLLSLPLVFLFSSD